MYVKMCCGLSNVLCKFYSMCWNNTSSVIVVESEDSKSDCLMRAQPSHGSVGDLFKGGIQRRFSIFFFSTMQEHSTVLFSALCLSMPCEHKGKRPWTGMKISGIWAWASRPLNHANQLLFFTNDQACGIGIPVMVAWTVQDIQIILVSIGVRESSS